MTPLTIARDMPLDDLVVRVYHLELLECQDNSEFQDAIRLMQHNLNEVMSALGVDLSEDRRIRRAINRVKTKVPHRSRTTVSSCCSRLKFWRIESGSIRKTWQEKNLKIQK